MFYTFGRAARCLLAGLILLAGCTASPGLNLPLQTPAPDLTPTTTVTATPSGVNEAQPSAGTGTPTDGAAPTAAARATSPAVAQADNSKAGSWAVSLLYPRPGAEIEMGQTIRLIARVLDANGAPVNNAQVSIAMQDPDGKMVAQVPASPNTEGQYRATWDIPHRLTQGAYHAVINASTGQVTAEGTGSFTVKNSTSEILLAKYGFWLDAPTLRGIVPQLLSERGDAANGTIQWGGYLIGMHVYPENWVELHWRTGDFNLDSPEAVRSFMLGKLGDLGFTPIRDIGPFERVQFKQWQAWKVGGRGQFSQNLVQWMIFYAPEVNKTFSIGTDAVLPPPGIDPHAVLRDSFTLYPDLHPTGVAPEPLPQRLPSPELLAPALGARFVGNSQPITLTWRPVHELAPDEYYQVRVDYNLREGNPTLTMTTRSTQLVLPPALYNAPSCHVFNWQVTLMHQTGVDADGQLRGEPLSYDSLYWYLIWQRPTGEEDPAGSICPNAQY